MAMTVDDMLPRHAPFPRPRFHRRSRSERARCRRRRARIRAAFGMVTIGALSIPPVVAMGRVQHDRVARQRSTPIATFSAGQRVLFRWFRSNTSQTAPVILSYHDLEPAGTIRRGNRYPVTPEQFARDMEMLDEAGFTTLTQRQLEDYLHGKPVPSRSVFLTFDDGTKGIWKYADPILAQHHFHAAAFVITGVVGKHQPYYLTWPELHRLYATGRWDVAAHTDLGHWRLPIDAKGDAAPFLVNRRWLAKQGRLETLDEWDRRITDDLRASRRELERHGFPAPSLFAYPFSALNLPTNDRRIPALLEQRASSVFEVTMINSQDAGLVTRSQVGRRLLDRVEVLNTMSIQRLFDRIAMWTPGQVSALHPFEETRRWDDQGHPTPAASFGGDSLTLQADRTGHATAYFARGRLSHWAEYRASMRVVGLGADRSGANGSLHVLTGSEGEYDVTVSNGWVRIYRDHGEKQVTVLDHGIPKGDAHDVAIAVVGGHVTVAIDGAAVFTEAERRTHGALPTGGVEVATIRSLPTSPTPTFVGLRIEPLGSVTS